MLLPPAYVVRREGNSFTLFVCPHRGGGEVRVPPRGVPGSGTPPGGVPGSGTPRGGTRVRYPPGGGYPGQVPPQGGTQVRYPPGGVPDSPPGRYPGQVPPRGGYPGRTTEGVLTTRRAVCLLRSRRTFLLTIKLFYKIDSNRIICMIDNKIKSGVMY